MNGVPKGVFAALLLFVLLSYAIFYIFNKPTVIFLTQEDSFFENLTAAGFLFASVLYLVAFWKVRRLRRADLFGSLAGIFLLVLSGIFFVGFGEEISWGQRIFQFETPKMLQELNDQGETNIHNLRPLKETKILAPARLFVLFWLFYCCLIPVIDKVHRRSSSFFKTVGLPIVPLRLGLLFPLTWLMMKAMETQFADEYHVVEVMECHFGVFFAVISALHFLSVVRASRQQAGQ